MADHLAAMSEPQTFRRLPQPVEAMQWTGDNLAGFRRWLGDDRVPPDINGGDPDDDALFLLDRGDRLAELPPGRWVVVSAGGAVVSCDPDEFAARYEATDRPHLTPEIPNDRGFRHMPPIETRPCTNDGPPHVVSVYESSAASAPHVWLTIDGRPDIEAGPDGTMFAHLTLDQARQLEEQLAWLRENHYQRGDNTDA